MRITILQGAFLPVPPLMGGAVEKCWFRLGQEFAIAGHMVVHLSRSHPQLPDSEEIEGVRHLRVSGYDAPASQLKFKMQDFLYSLRACRAVPQDSDVVVTNTFWSPLLLSARLRPKAYVSVERFPKGQMGWYRQARLRANSTPVAAAIRRELKVKDHRRVTMIPNPLPFVVHEPLETLTKQPVLLYCGRVHPEKGLHLLIEALQLLNCPWPLRIVGPWQVEQGGGGLEYRDKLVRMAHGLKVIFVGPLYETEALNSEYRNAAIFLYPSIAETGETFGSAPLEAMAWGGVPIVSGLECFQDFIRSGENGLTFDHRSPNAVKQLADAIHGLSNDAHARERIARQAIAVRQTHAPDTIARQFLRDFVSVLESAQQYR